MATLERLSGWAIQALRLGTLLLLQQCIRTMAQPGGDKRALLARAKELLAALDHLPWNDASPTPTPAPPPVAPLPRGATSPLRGPDR